MIGFGASYYVVSVVADNSDDDAVVRTSTEYNLQEVSSVASEYSDEIESFEGLVHEIAGKKMPTLCSTVCNPSTLDQDKLRELRMDYLDAFYRAQGSHAFADPIFRLKLEELSFISKAFPKPLRVVLQEIDDVRELPVEKQQKWKLALHLEGAVFAEMSTFRTRYRELRTDSRRIKRLRAIIQECRLTPNQKKIISECQSKIN
jgi:hypothetical protein